MSAVATERNGAQRGGCLKCGEKGHWARDCTAPKSQWLSSRITDNQYTASEYRGSDENRGTGNENNQNPEMLGAAAAAKKKRQRPKVTFELLKETNGLPDLYHNFPTLFKHQFRGHGHEVSDLRRLLELYKRWQDRVFPHGEFDHFIAAVQNLSGKNVLKTELQDMRVNLLKSADDLFASNRKEADEEDVTTEHNEMNPVVDIIEDDDELLAMMNDDENVAMPMLHNEEDADEELLELAVAMGNASQNDDVNLDEVGDDELLEMAMQDDG